MVIYRSKQFIIRTYQKRDEVSLQRHINNKKIYRNTLRIPYPYSLRDAREWIQQATRNARRKTRSSEYYAIVIDSEVVGAVGFNTIQGHKAEIGYWLSEEYWGRGIMTQAVRAMVLYGFRHLALRRIYSHVFVHNKASMRVLMKAGFIREGLMRKAEQKEGKFIDIYQFAKVR